MIRLLVVDWVRDQPIFMMMMAVVREVPVSRWLNWAHIGTTVTIVIFLWTQYQDYLTQRVLTQAQIVSLTAQIEAIRQTEEQRHRGVDNQLKDITKRVDIHRDDIRSLQQQINMHFDRAK